MQSLNFFESVIQCVLQIHSVLMTGARGRGKPLIFVVLICILICPPNAGPWKKNFLL